MSDVDVSEGDRYILTHPVTPAGPIPTALDPNGVYPYVSFSQTADRPIPRQYRVVTLRNQHVTAVICPDSGGRVLSLVHGISGSESLYAPEVIRPTRILPRFCFVPGGIEVSFPISHSPTQNERVAYAVERAAGRVYVTCGERELRYGMQWSVEYSLGPDDHFLTQRLLLHNPGRTAHPWMSWSNAALPANRDTEYHFPKGRVLSHASRLETIDWETRGPRREADVTEMTGFFWQTKDAAAFGAFTPSLGSGLYHVADSDAAPGMKLWTYGSGEDRAWATLGSAGGQPYIEIQGGPIADQATRLLLQPGETRSHTEFWIPTDRPLDIYALALPAPDLRHPDAIPRFSWARPEEVDPWLSLADSHASGGEVPVPPDPTDLRWAPSGMEHLDGPFAWALHATDGAIRGRWYFHYGTWLAGVGRIGEAIEQLTASDVGIGKVLLARLHRVNGAREEARSAMEAADERWLQLHPQVVVERDQLLREIGPHTLEERAKWLQQVDSLNDEWIVERRVQLLIDQGDAEAAKALLLSSRFQKVHQTYTRTELWRQICHALGDPEDLPTPPQLGEDRLAPFGAYRDFT